MHPVIKTLKTALTYAKFEHTDIKEATITLVNELGEDLRGDEQEYEPGTKVEEAEAALVIAMNTRDSTRETIEDVIEESA